MSDKTIRFEIKRQDGPGKAPYWQKFSIPYEHGHNVVSALMKIRENPVTDDGQKVEVATRAMHVAVSYN